MTLRLDWCSHDAASYACRRWHYAEGLPTGKLVKIGVWERDAFAGVVIFSRGSSPRLGWRYDLPPTSLCELTRIALREHEAPVSRIVAVALRLLHRSNPGLRLVVSFADPAQGHHGGIYQAGNWIYTGESERSIEIYLRGRWRNVRGAYNEAKRRGIITDYGDARIPGSNLRITRGKHRYVYPLDAGARTIVEAMRTPYPERELAA